MRKYFIAALAAAALTAFAIPGVAFGVSPNTSTLDANFNPSATGTVYTDGGMFVETTTLHDTDAGTPTTPTVEPVPTTMVELDFDKLIRFTPGTVPTCTGSLAGSTQSGMQNCGDAYIGGGYATLCGASGGPGTACNVGGDPSAPGVLNAQVAAYNGPVVGSDPTIRLQARADHTPLGPITQELTGTLAASPAGAQYGERLTVPVPLIPPAAPGLAAITDFSVNINNDNYVQAKCKGNQVWNYRATFTYSGGSSDVIIDNDPCT